MILTHLVSAAAEKSTDNTLLAWILAIATVITAPLLGYLASRQATKQAAAKANRDALSEDKNADVNSWDKLVVSLQNELKRLSTRVEDLEKEGKENRQRIGELETAVRAGDVKYRIAIQYIRDIIAWTKLAFHSDAVPPVFPPEIAPDLNMEYTTVKSTEGDK